jgi:hypothetical protein
MYEEDVWPVLVKILRWTAVTSKDLIKAGTLFSQHNQAVLKSIQALPMIISIDKTSVLALHKSKKNVQSMLMNL